MLIRLRILPATLFTETIFTTAYISSLAIRTGVIHEQISTTASFCQNKPADDHTIPSDYSCFLPCIRESSSISTQ